MALSAADRQNGHELEGAPDPFPSLAQPDPVNARTSPTLPLDAESEEAFPSLASAAPTASVPAKSAWAAGPRLKATTPKVPVFTDSFTLPAIDLSNSGKGGKPATLGEVIKQVITKYKVKVEASANRKAHQTTFHMKAESQKELDKAKHSLLALVGPVIISSKTSNTQHVRDIPAHILSFILVRKATFLSAARDGTVNLALNAANPEITASGDREAVIRVIESIKQTIKGFTKSLTSVKISIPKRQHRLLTGANADVILTKSDCAVVVGKPKETGDEVTVWGQPTDIPAGLFAVMEQANSQYIHELTLPGPITLSKQVALYFHHVHYHKTIKTTHPNVEVYLPSPDAATLSVDLVGAKADVDAVVKQISELVVRLIGGTRDMTVDWLLHRLIARRIRKKWNRFHEVHNVNVYVYRGSQKSSNVLLVYDPLTPGASLIPGEKKKHLDDVEKEILKWGCDAAHVKTETVSVEKRWHGSVVGNRGTTLNAHSTEFDIDKEYVGRIVGSQGAGANKLRDQLGVKVDVLGDVDEKEKECGKQKKVVPQKSKVKITGRKKDVEEAKKRILAQIDRLADETQEILKIPAQYHSSLIGQNGKYAIRLEEKYSVKITFPCQSSENGKGKSCEQLKSHEVLVEGGKKGVAGAKSELLEAAEFEKASNNILKFTVPTRILGRGGASIYDIKNSTNAQIDIEEGSEETTSITVRGTKKAIAAAMAISDQVAEDTTTTIGVKSEPLPFTLNATKAGMIDTPPKRIYLNKRCLVLQPRTNPADATRAAEVKIADDAKEFFAVRNLDQAESYFSALHYLYHHRLVHTLITHALASTEPSTDCKLVAEFFARIYAKNGHGCAAADFLTGFAPTAESVDETAAETPTTLERFAMMVKAANLDGTRRRKLATHCSVHGAKFLELIKPDMPKPEQQFQIQEIRPPQEECRTQDEFRALGTRRKNKIQKNNDIQVVSDFLHRAVLSGMCSTALLSQSESQTIGDIVQGFSNDSPNAFASLALMVKGVGLSDGRD